jgi:hypothetical protein
MTYPTNLRQFPRRTLSLQPRPNIAINLRDYERLVEEFCNEKEGRLNNDVLRKLYLGEFVLWLRKRMEMTNEKPAN